MAGKERRLSAQEAIDGGATPEQMAEFRQNNPEFVANAVEEMANQDKPIFPGGPNQKMVDAWKARFGDIYSLPFEDDVYIWRCITREEYKSVMRIRANTMDDTYFRQEKICEICVLWPLGYRMQSMAPGKAGVPSVLSDFIMEKSGFTPTGEPERL